MTCGFSDPFRGDKRGDAAGGFCGELRAWSTMLRQSRGTPPHICASKQRAAAPHASAGTGFRAAPIWRPLQGRSWEEPFSRKDRVRRAVCGGAEAIAWAVSDPRTFLCGVSFAKQAAP